MGLRWRLTTDAPPPNSTADMPFMAKLCRRTDDAAFRQEMDAMNAGCQVYYPDILRKEVRPLLQELKQMGMQVALQAAAAGNVLSRS